MEDQMNVFAPGMQIGLSGRVAETASAVVGARHAEQILQVHILQLGEEEVAPSNKQARASRILSYAQAAQGDRDVVSTNQVMEEVNQAQRQSYTIQLKAEIEEKLI